MAPNYGDSTRPTDVVPDWLLGGNRKRRVLQALAEERPDGWTAAELSERLGCGRTTAHEILRSLRPLGVLEARPGGGVRLDNHSQLARALRGLLAALQPLESQVVERPPRRRGPT
jgi:DNA-binding IclR family transcriptional regulator